MKSPLDTPFTDGKIKGMSGGDSAGKNKGGKAAMPKMSPKGGKKMDK